MNTEQRLNQIADTYRSRGYKVVIRPSPNDLPDFAKDFKIEIVARRDDGNVLVSAKRNQSELEADRELVRYAESIEQQRGWRFDVFVLESESRPPEKYEAKELSEEGVRHALNEVEGMLQAGFVQQALSAAWAVLETAMRRRLRADGQKIDEGSTPRTMLNELYSNGSLAISVFRDLERLLQVRNAIVHGFATSPVEEDSVRLLVETARMLLEEAREAKRIAWLSRRTGHAVRDAP